MLSWGVRICQLQDKNKKVVNMIASMIDGRIRFRHRTLKGEGYAATMHDRLYELKGVRDVSINSRIGSLLVLFSNTEISAEEVLKVIGKVLRINCEWFKQEVQKLDLVMSSPKTRRYIKRGLLAALGTTLLLALLADDYHPFGGAAFMTLLTMHLIQNRRTLKR